MAAWVYQTKKSSSWYVGWMEAGRRRCRSCGGGEGGKDLADRLRGRLEAASSDPGPDAISSDVIRRDLLIAKAEADGDLGPTGPGAPPGQPPVARVYFLEAVGVNRIKVGVAVNVPHRWRALNTASPVPLRLLGTEPGGRALEADLHRQFARHRVRFEWFEAAPEIRDYIAAFATPPERISDLECRGGAQGGAGGRG